jgi:predicted transcriptional regulator
MVAPNYSKARSELAKALGLGLVRKAGKKGAKKKAAA